MFKSKSQFFDTQMGFVKQSLNIKKSKNKNDKQ